MSKFDEAIATYENELKNTLKIKDYDLALLKKVAKGLGPSIYNNDSSKVSASDQAEMDRVRDNFCVKKLGLKADAKVDAAIKEVAAAFGSSNKNKYRAIFYYLLVKKFGKEKVYA
jgi:hypothetical protein